ncbi:MAG: CoA pyrophosphatase [Desulfomonile sp.]|jgi:8-oxo-dGTP pyrophosphatase MutT (NUDIX family)|nr:CoA pyrophosphatase [Deltaproteobacteria bacterium]
MNVTNHDSCESRRFEDTVTDLLRERGKKSLSTQGVVTAAVLVPLFYTNCQVHVLLTKRSNHVEHHKGEISFPGGKLDSTDSDLLACALRETAEEIGVDPVDVRILGELDDFYTVATSFLVVPFVGIIPYPYDFRTSPREIDCLLPVPLEVFFDPTRRTEDIWEIDGRPIQVISYKWQDHNIWGATARILKHFVDMLSKQRSLYC